MIKKFCFLVLIASFSFLFLYCSKREQTPSKEMKSESNRIVITVNGGPREGAEDEKKEWDYKIKLFEEKYPNIKVEPTSWQYSPEVFMSRALTGGLTDLIQTWATEGEIVTTKNLALDITDIFNNWEGSKDILEIVLEPFKRNGRLYAFPISAYSMSLFYNKQLFKEAGIVDDKGEANPPDTWEEFVETAKKITDKEKGIIGFAINGETPRVGWHFLNWGWQAGGEFEIFENGKWKAVFDSPEMVNALQFIKDLRWKHNVIQSDTLITYQEIWNMFAANQVGMMIEPANDFALNFLKYKYNYDLKNVGIVLLPAGPKGRWHQMGADYYIINPNISEEKKDAVFKWCIYYISPEWAEARCKFLTVNNKTVGAPQLQIFKGERLKKQLEIFNEYRNVEYYKEYQENVMNYLKLEPPFYTQQLYSEILSPAIQSVLSDKNADPTQILKEGVKTFQKNFLNKVEIK